MQHSPLPLSSFSILLDLLSSAVARFLLTLCFCYDSLQKHTNAHAHTASSSQHFASSPSLFVSSSSRVGSFSVELSAPQGAAGKQNNAEQLVIWNATRLSS